VPAAASIAALARVGLQPIDKLTERFRRHLRADRDGEIERRDLRDGLEIGDRIVGERLVDVAVDRHGRNGAEQKRLAIRCGRLHGLHADAAWAPARFSTMTGWSRATRKCSAISRASASPEPPAANGKTMRIGSPPIWAWMGTGKRQAR
jgi:hypothetical protein